MKYFLTVIIALLPLLSGAQSTKLLEIDASSFAPVQTDVLSGVAIDKIGKDPSQRPCARIKMHINRMNKEEINGLSVRTVGGSVVVTKCIVASEGNGLIIELTAKAPTRFYLHHEKYGDSNEVSLNLEGNREYRINAMLNTTHSIVVSSNTPDAEVYVDGVFKGRISPSFDLTVSDVYPGNHRIKVISGTLSNELIVDVNSANIHFRIDLNHQLARPQFVMFMVTPPEASLFIDNQPYLLNQYGEMAEPLMLGSGSYSYVVSAKDYHEERGQFVVNGLKVEKVVNLKPSHGYLKVAGDGQLQGASVYVDGSLIGTAPCTSSRLSSGSHAVRIVKHMYKESSATVEIRDGETLDYRPSLQADFAKVTLKTTAGADIYVDGKKKGTSTWTGDVRSGEHLFEAVMSGYRTSSIYRTISATPSAQMYDIPAPTPILGIVNIISSPVSDVYVDEKHVGRSPLSLDLIVGKHTVVLKKDGYKSQKQMVTVSEGQVSTLNFALEKIASSTTATNYSSYSSYTTTQKAAVKTDTDKLNASKYKNKGLVHSLELSYGYQLGKGDVVYANYGYREYGSFHPVCLTYACGYKFNNYVSVALGTGLMYNLVNLRLYHGDYFATYNEQRFTALNIPLFCNVKTYLTKSKCQPMLSLSGGVFLPYCELLLDAGLGCCFKVGRKSNMYLLATMSTTPRGDFVESDECFYYKKGFQWTPSIKLGFSFSN